MNILITNLKLKDGLIDTEKAPNILQDNKIRLKGDTFDNDAIIMKNIKSNKVILQNYKTNQRILEFDKECAFRLLTILESFYKVFIIKST